MTIEGAAAKMPNRYSHLCAKALKVIDLDDDARAFYIKSDHWIAYPKAIEHLAGFQELVSGPVLNRPECRLLISHPFNGKTWLLKKFVAMNPESEHEDGERKKVPVLFLQAPGTPSALTFYGEILTALAAPFSFSDRLEKRMSQALKLLDKVECRVVVVDEIHNIIAGKGIKYTEMHTALRFLTNEAHLSLVMGGIDSATNAFRTDTQWVTRAEPLFLEKWQKNENFLNLLFNFERNLPLRLPSGIADNDEMVAAIFHLSGGLIGKVREVMTKAANLAIRDGKEAITIKTIRAVNVKPIDDSMKNANGLH